MVSSLFKRNTVRINLFTPVSRNCKFWDSKAEWYFISSPMVALSRDMVISVKSNSMSSLAFWMVDIILSRNPLNPSNEMSSFLILIEIAKVLSFFSVLEILKEFFATKIHFCLVF